MADKKVRISDLKVASSIEGAFIEVSVPSGDGYDSKKADLSKVLDDAIGRVDSLIGSGVIG